MTPATSTPFKTSGFRSWYSIASPNRKMELEIFVVDFETSIWSPESEEEPGSNKKWNGEPEETVNGLVLYFITEAGDRQQAFIKHEPYFYLKMEKHLKKGDHQLEKIRRTIFSAGRGERIDRIKKVEVCELYDSDDLLFPEKQLFLKVTVDSPRAVPQVRDRLTSIQGVIEWREADIQFHHRVAIDKQINIGRWYRVVIERGFLGKIELLEDRLDIPELKLVAYDIEVYSPMTRDPSIEKDQISMISIFSSVKDVVLVNSEVVKSDELEDVTVLIRSKDDEHPLPWVDWQFTSEFNVSPKDHEFATPVRVKKCRSEKVMLHAFIRYMNSEKPDVITDFYGDRFDLPFIAGRAKHHGMNFEKMTGISFKWKTAAKESAGKNYMKDVDTTILAGPFHLDAFLWNDKYSYLPKKDLGLKPSVQRRLRIIPIGRESLWIMDENPAETVAYAASDGYITWRYVKEIILDFCISMGRMFPVPSCELLTKRAGSLDDLLIDRIGHHKNIVARKRFSQKGMGRLTDNIVIAGIAYTGGAVDAPNPGIWRRDLVKKIAIDQKKLERIAALLPSIFNTTKAAFLNKTALSAFQRICKPFFHSENNYLKYLKDSNEENYYQLAMTILNEEGSLDNETESALKQVNQQLKELEPGGDSLDELLEKITGLSTGDHRLKGVHCDVTSMYPSQIRQFKVQPSGIVSESICENCHHKEAGMTCAFDHGWTLKINAVKPCEFKDRNGICRKTGVDCSYDGDEDSCKHYDPGKWKNVKKQECYCVEEGRVICYTVNDDSGFDGLKVNDSYYGSGISAGKSVYSSISEFVSSKVKGTKVSNELNRIDLTKHGKSITLNPPPNTFMFVEVKQKNLTILVSVESRICQKAYDFVADIMDQFFMTRVNHKKEAGRLKAYISVKKSMGEEIDPELETQLLYHDSTQLGLKVPLNSIYGLLGMKAGVHNASMPCAGITTALSADLIRWAVDYLSGIGIVTEYDTDGVWIFVPEDFPIFISLEVKDDGLGINDRTTINVLAEILNCEISENMQNPYYWKNNGEEIVLQPKNLLKFEQDGPYDFQMVMGKKKYIVFNYEGDSNWKVEEITGLESKRADFSLLHKTLQEDIIKAYQVNYGRATIEQLFEQALKTSAEFIARIKEGKIDEEYLIIPKSIAQPISEYKTILPQVEGAMILQELGYNIEIGMKIELLMIKSASKKKSLSVIPRQLFDFPFEDIKKILIKRGIATLGFTFGTIKTKEDIKREIIDTKAYIADLVGEDRLIDRMIGQLARAMKIELRNVPKILGIKPITSNKSNLMQTAMPRNGAGKKGGGTKKGMSGEFSKENSRFARKRGREREQREISKPARNSVYDFASVGKIVMPADMEFTTTVKKKQLTDQTDITTGGNPVANKKESSENKTLSKNDHSPLTGHLAKFYSKKGTSSTIYTKGNRFDTSVLSLEEEVINYHVSEPEIYVCPECGLTWELEECIGNKCPVCQTTLEYKY
ncbi:MAG: 3'-5' exonuclease [Candidatus Hodarchaeales archaeon]